MKTRDGVVAELLPKRHMFEYNHFYLSLGSVSYETLADSWGVTMADHGGLLVAARDYHHTPS